MIQTLLSRRVLLADLPLCLLLAEPTLADGLPQPPAGDYRYAVEVNGRGQVGDMTVKLTETSGEILAEIQRKIQVKVLGVTVYRNDSTVTQTLKRGRLTALHRETNDDGDKSALTVALVGDKLEVNDGGKTWSLDQTLLPTSPWNPAILSRAQLLDTKSGKAIAVTTEAKGQKEMVVAGHRLKATRYDQRGGIARDLWFDDKGRMVLHREGNTVTMTLEHLKGFSLPRRVGSVR